MIAARVIAWLESLRADIRFRRLDYTSSASRQHYIDTGRYLRRGEADEA
jgi:hypothetical protein